MNKYRQLRKERKMSQATLAQRLGVSQTAVSQWETNKNYPDISTIKELAEIFSVTTDYLLNVDSRKLKKDNEVVVYNRVPAGVEWANIQDKYGYEEIGSRFMENGKDFIGLRMVDDRCSPLFMKDDILLVEIRDNCENGDYALVQAHANDAEIRRVFYQSNGILTQPVSYTGEGEFYVTNSRDRVNILGVVREVRRSFFPEN